MREVKTMLFTLFWINLLKKKKKKKETSEYFAYRICNGA